MAAPVHNKYYLKTLHEEIDLLDRKLAHMLKYEEFATDAARKTSASKMQAKRDLLERTAKLLVSEGIEFKESDLPRSYRPSEAEGDQEAIAPEVEAAKTDTAATEQVAAFSPAKTRQFPSPFAGTVLDGRAHVEAYKRSRTRVPSADAVKS